MIKILFCTDTLSAGGVERQLVNLVLGLDRAEFEPYVIALYGEKAGRSMHFASTLHQANIPIEALNLGMGVTDKLNAMRKLVALSWQLKPDLIQMMNYHSNMLARLSRPLMPPSVRLIGTVRNKQTIKQLRYQRWTWRMCSTLICNSPDLKADLINSAGIPERYIHFIPNGLDIERFQHDPHTQLRQQIAPDSQLLFVMLGRISRQKSPHLFVEAMGLLQQQGHSLTSVKLVIVGERTTHPLHDVQHLLDATIEKYHLHQHVIQHPPTQQPEAYFHAADVTVLTSLYEGLPNAMLESLAAGRPIIISEAANAAGIVEPGVTGWVFETNSVTSLATTLAEVLDLPKKQLQQMGENCRRVANQFTISSMVEAHQNLYHQQL